MAQDTTDDAVRRMLDPRSVAIIGASEDQAKFGGRALQHLLSQRYGGLIYPINPRRSQLLGLKAYPSIKDTPDKVDVALLAVPRDSAVQHIADCAAAGVRGAILITNQFADESEEGAAAEAELVRISRAAGMRLVGPNCLGLFSPVNQLALCSSPVLAGMPMIKGAIGMVSQSGAMMATVYDRARRYGSHFSHCVSVGNQADLEICDFVDCLVEDSHTRAICCYVEGIKSGERLRASAKKAVAAGKPWLMLKAGRTPAGAQAAYSHTASLAGDHETLEAVCRDAGIVLVKDLDSMVLACAAMARYPRRRIGSVSIVATSGGASTLSADAAADHGLPLTALAPDTCAGLDRLYSARQGKNPIDLGANAVMAWSDAAPATMALVAADPAPNAVLAVMTTAALLGPTTAQMVEASEAQGKPCIYVVMPGALGEDVRAVLLERKMPFADGIDEAVIALDHWYRWSTLQPDAPAERPASIAQPAAKALDSIAGKEVPAGALESLLTACGLPLAPQAICADEQAALAAARRIGFPVVAKLLSPQLVHKSDFGAVALDIGSEQELSAALAGMAAKAKQALQGDLHITGYLLQKMMKGRAEIIIGIKRDPQFGPMLVVGAGGILVETLRDAAISSVPVTTDKAKQLLGGLAVHKVLAGPRGRPALDVDALADAIVRTSWLAHDMRDSLAELDLNPVLVNEAGAGCTIVDARMLLA